MIFLQLLPHTRPACSVSFPGGMSPFDNQTKLNLHERKNTTSVDQFNEFSLSISPTCPFSHPLFFLGHLEARASWTVVVRQESQHPVLSDCALAQVPTAPLQDCHFPDMPQQEAQDKSFGERGTKHLLSPVWAGVPGLTRVRPALLACCLIQGR